MPLQMKSDRFEMVDSWEIRIGQESIKHHFGRKVPIGDAVKLATAWLETLGQHHEQAERKPEQ